MINFLCSLTIFASLCTPTLGALSILKPSQGGTGLVSAVAGDVGKVLKVTDNSPFTFELATDSEGSATFPFTPNSWGNSTSTVIGFTQGIISNASSTFSYLGDGLVGANNGRLYGFASTSLFGFTPASNATTITVAGTANQLTSSAGAQDLSANRAWTLSLPNHVIFPGNFFVNNSTTTNATTTSLDILGTLTFNGVTGSTWTTFCTTITGGAGLCDGTDATASASWPFTPGEGFGVATQSTTTALQLFGGVQASSTSYLATTTFYGTGDDIIHIIGTNSQHAVHLMRTDTGGIHYSATNPTTGQTNTDGSDFGIDSTGNTIIRQREALDIQFLTNGTEKATIESNGNVGIGTTTPYSALAVAGQVVADYFTSTTTSRNTFPNLTGTNATTTTALNLSAFTSALLQTDAEGDVAEYAGTSCTNQFVRALSALGVATCATVDISADTNLTAGTGITLTNDDLSIDTSQNIATLSNLTSNGYIKTSGGNGTLGIQAVPIPIADGGTATTTWYDTGIAFYNSSLGTLSQPSRANSNQNLVWDGVTPGLGIGTTSPWGLLSVNANGMGAGIPQFAVGSSTATNFIVASSGSVGVATTSPTSNFKFSVTGTGYFSSNATIGGALTLGTDLSVANGGTGASTFTNNRVLTGNTASAIVDEANLTFDGTLLTVTGNITGTGVNDFGGSTSFELPNGAAPTVDATGETAVDTTSDQFIYYGSTAKKVLGNGSFYPSFTYATSTSWTGTTTIPLGTAYIGETWNGVQCFTDTGTLNVSLYDGTNRMNMFNASTTVGTVTLSTNNTFTAAEKRYVDVGTPASSPTKISCTVDKGITAD